MSDPMELVVNNELQPQQAQQQQAQQQQQREVPPFTEPTTTTTTTEPTTANVEVNDNDDDAAQRNNMKKYYAIRTSPKLDGSAIFTSYNDCKSYIVIPNGSDDDNHDDDGEGNDVEQDVSTLENATSAAVTTEAITETTTKEGDSPQELGGQQRKRIEYDSFDDWDDAVEYIEVFLSDITNSRKTTRKESANSRTVNGEDEDENNNIRNNRKRKLVAGAGIASSSESSTTAATKKSKASTSSPGADRREEQFNRHFDTNYERLIEFQNDYGDCDVPHRIGNYDMGNGKTIDYIKYGGLGQWVSRVRTEAYLYKEDPSTSLLSEDQFMKLESIGFCMNPKRYKELSLPSPSINDKVLGTNNSGGSSIGGSKNSKNRATAAAASSKVNVKKRKHAAGSGSTKSPPSISKQERFERLFTQNIKVLEEFIQEYGECDVPSRQGEFAIKSDDGTLKGIDWAKYGVLTQWCGQVRIEMNIYNNYPESSKLNADQMKQLQDMKFGQLPKRHVMKDGSPVPPASSTKPKNGGSGRTGSSGSGGRTPEQKEARKLAAMQKKLAKTKDDLDEEKRDQFFKMYEKAIPLLEEFKSEYGDCDVPNRNAEYKVGNKIIDLTNKFAKLGAWVAKIRTQFKLYQVNRASSYLDGDQVKYLRSIGFCLEPQRYKESLAKSMWSDSRFQELKDFHAKHGHANVPFKPSTPLRSWLSRLKTAYTESLEGGAATDITDERVAKLEGLGVVMKKQDRLPFEVQLQRWLAYREENEGQDPPSIHQIGNWISGLRRKYVDKKEGRTTNLTQAQIDRLTQLGFQWQCKFPRKKKPGPVKSFEARVEELIGYKARYGDTLVPYTYPEGLGVWSHVLRYEYRKYLKGQKTTLTEERIDALKQAGFTFETPRFFYRGKESTSNNTASTPIKAAQGLPEDNDELFSEGHDGEHKTGGSASNSSDDDDNHGGLWA